MHQKVRELLVAIYPYYVGDLTKEWTTLQLEQFAG